MSKKVKLLMLEEDESQAQLVGPLMLREGREIS
jgi:hypothetical protein